MAPQLRKVNLLGGLFGLAHGFILCKFIVLLDDLYGLALDRFRSDYSYTLLGGLFGLA